MLRYLSNAQYFNPVPDPVGIKIAAYTAPSLDCCASWGLRRCAHQNFDHHAQDHQHGGMVMAGSKRPPVDR
jgi:hypothetical protein